MGHVKRPAVGRNNIFQALEGEGADITSVWSARVCMRQGRVFNTGSSGWGVKISKAHKEDLDKE